MAEGLVKWEELSWNNHGEGSTLARSTSTGPGRDSGASLTLNHVSIGSDWD